MKLTKANCFYGIYPIRFVSHGEWADPEIMYKNHVFNYWDIETMFYEIWRGEHDYLIANLTTENDIDNAFENWMSKNGKRVKDYLNFLIENEE